MRPVIFNLSASKCVTIPLLVSRNIIELPKDLITNLRALIDIVCALEGVETSLIGAK